MSSQQEKQANKKFKAGQDNLTTGIFQWSKDYTSGASNFSEAAKLYSAIGMYDKTLLALQQLIICNQKLLDNWALARNYEEILDIYLKHYPQTTFDELKKVASLGFANFRMADSVDKGLQMLSRVAKEMISRGQVKEGIQLLQDAYQSSLEEQKSFKKKDLFYQVVGVLLQNELFAAVEKMYMDQIKYLNGHDCHQQGLIKILMILMQHQATRAQKEMYQLSNLIPAFLESHECEVADELIKSYKKGDSDRFLKWTTKPQITCIFPVTIIKKLREVKVPSAAMQEQPKEEGNAIKELLF